VKNNLLVTGGFHGEIICKVFLFHSHLLPHFCQAIIIRVWCLFVGLGNTVFGSSRNKLLL
jgi:hypothetical protein